MAGANRTGGMSAMVGADRVGCRRCRAPIAVRDEAAMAARGQWRGGRRRCGMGVPSMVVQ
jgi:hypothetical protein